MRTALFATWCAATVACTQKKDSNRASASTPAAAASTLAGAPTAKAAPSAASPPLATASKPAPNAGAGSIGLAASRAVSEGRFATSLVCAQCHSNAEQAVAMRDELGNGVAPYDLWRSTMMANAARDPLWRANVSAEVMAIPSRKKEIEAKCMRCHSPMASVEAKLNGEPALTLALLYGDNARSQLALDGASCALCHQISPIGLGTAASFSGHFSIGDAHIIYGPHANPFTMPMQRHVGYVPTAGSHISKSALCGSCHTLHTDALHPNGSTAGGRLAEQTPYLEWQNSAFNTKVPNPGPQAAACQHCHAPTDSAAGVPIKTVIARRPDGGEFPPLAPRAPFGRHVFVGGNTLIPQILRDNRAALQPHASDAAFNATIALTRKQLREKTATLTIRGMALNNGRLTGEVHIAVATGHKFPTAHPSRRAWLHVLVKDAKQKTIFESGGYDDAGQLLGADNKPLASELVGGPYQHHTSKLTAADHPLVYEVVMGTAKNTVTYRLMQGTHYLKDNRLLPPGWVASAADENIRPVGVNDADFAAAGDSIAIAVTLPDGATGPVTVTATLLYQSLSARYAAELFTADTPEVRAFKAMYLKADRKPEWVARAKVLVPAP